MRDQSEARGIFRRVTSGDGEINLLEAALLIAKEIEYPNLDISKYSDKIDLIADQIKGRTMGNSDAFSLVSEINKYLFTEEGFRGNEDDYYDPRNSFLNDVLDRKTGIPIALSVMYMEVGARVGLPLSGVGFPGHFIIKYSAQSEILIDPFNKGRILSGTDCQEMLNQMYAGGVKLKAVFLESVTKKQILARMLQNLKSIYINSQDFVKALSVVDMLLIIDPDNTSELRDRGLISYNLECFASALSDVEEYLRLVPQAEDSEAIRNFIAVIKDLVGRMN
jgi:regulator of sirC expression with transglutaminase-like and TPR domain